MIALALEGIRILDLGTLTPGKYCTSLLADLGVDVIRVERPIPQDSQESQLSNEDLILNRNKRSITLNLRTEEAKQVFYQLSEKADVILEGYRPGVTKRMGIDYDTIRKINPRIIYCSLSGFGKDGPYSQLPAFDIVFMATSGLLSLIGGRHQPPIVPGLLLSDTAAGLFPTIGLLTALLSRERTGKGQFIDISMLDGAFSLLSISHGVQYPATEASHKQEDPFLTGLLPGYNVYETKDAKYLALGIGRQQSWESLCQVIGREDYTGNQWETGEKGEEIRSFLKQTFKTKTRDEWLSQLRALDIEVGPVNTPEEAFADPQLLHRQMVLEVEHPTRGKTSQVGLPVKLSETPAEVRRAAPLIGQDTEEILRELGYTQERIEGLRKAEAI